MGCGLPAESQMEFLSEMLDFLKDGQIDCPSFFVYWGCAKETKKLLQFCKMTKFTQRIATIVALCYNKKEKICASA